MCFLVDGAHPEWAIFVAAFECKTDSRNRKFANAQERVRKDTECVFGITVQRFHIPQRPLRNWHQEDLSDLVKCCVILHSMTIVDRFGKSQEDISEDTHAKAGAGFSLFGRRQVPAVDAAMDDVDLFAAGVAAFDQRMQNQHEHCLLKEDLVEHINRN